MKRLSMTFVIAVVLLATSSAFAAVNPNMVIQSTSSAERSGVNFSQPTVAIIFDNTGTLKLYPEAVNGVVERIANEIAPKRISLLNRYRVASGTDVDTKFNEYLEENAITDPKTLKKGDIANFGRKCGYEYVLLISFVGNGNYDLSNYALIVHSNTLVVTADLVAKLVEVETEGYLYRKNITQKNDSATLTTLLPVSGSPSPSKAWQGLVNKCVDVLIEDLNTEILRKLK